MSAGRSGHVPKSFVTFAVNHSYQLTPENPHNSNAQILKNSTIKIAPAVIKTHNHRKLCGN